MGRTYGWSDVIYPLTLTHAQYDVAHHTNAKPSHEEPVESTEPSLE